MAAVAIQATAQICVAYGLLRFARNDGKDVKTFDGWYKFLFYRASLSENRFALFRTHSRETTAIMTPARPGNRSSGSSRGKLARGCPRSAGRAAAGGPGGVFCRKPRIAASTSSSPSPVKTMPCSLIERRAIASSDSKVWLMVPSEVLAHRIAGRPQDAKTSIWRRSGESGTINPPAPSITSGPGRAGIASRPWLDPRALPRRGYVRRCGQLEAVGFGQDALLAQPRKAAHGFAVRFALKPRLDRLPIARAERARERRAEHGLANPCVRAGDDEAHARLMRSEHVQARSAAPRSSRRRWRRTHST